MIRERLPKDLRVGDIIAIYPGARFGEERWTFQIGSIKTPEEAHRTYYIIDRVGADPRSSGWCFDVDESVEVLLPGFHNDPQYLVFKKDQVDPKTGEVIYTRGDTIYYVPETGEVTPIFTCRSYVQNQNQVIRLGAKPIMDAEYVEEVIEKWARRDRTPNRFRYYD